EVRIVVQPETEKDQNLVLKFSIQDTGVGMPPERLEYIFEKFTQLDGTYSRQHEGTGLGLSIVKKLIDLMGGRIAVYSQVGSGTTFNFTLRTKQPSQEMELNNINGDRATRPAGEACQILVAEDNPVNQLMVRRMLEKLGHKVTVVENGQKAIDCLKKERFDLVLMDVQMPIMDGLEATKQIRNDTSGDLRTDIPIIAMTAMAMAGDKESLLEAGMDDYVAKPIEKDKLQKIMRRVVFKSGAA
ncbi:MAG: response regulator, partial [Deltaproteobacteria bacterium]|nr:response regulator [Deltaproteobacteria bacterium]